MLPVIALVGRPNVGKSTLFNMLTKTRDALVADQPGLTRDRQYGAGRVGEKPFIVVDTGGIAEVHDQQMDNLTDLQVAQAIDEADHVFFLVDAKAGLTTADEAVAKRLRLMKKSVTLVVNKADRIEATIAASEFYALGLGEPAVIAATHNRGIAALVETTLEKFEPEDAELSEDDRHRVHIAIIGRPNVGKSTLVNRMLGEDRVVVCDRPGTTRDSVYIPFDRRDQKYMLIDTAGVRRRAKVTDMVEKFSVIKTLQAIEKAHVVLMIIDARDGIGDQDLRMIGWVMDAGKGLAIAFNKWDGMDEYDRNAVKEELDRKCQFIDYARRYFISALHGTGVGKLYFAIDEAYASANHEIPTAQLTKVLDQATRDHQPPMLGGRRIKMRYAHIGGHHPLTIILHGKQLDRMPGSYARYLSNYFRKSFKLMGVPVMLRFRTDDNPFVKK
jgi:GTPase